MHMDPLMPVLTGAGLGILLLGLLLHRARLSVVSGYLIAGIVLGPAGLAVLEDEATLSHLGAIGVLLLLFFAGMEVSLPTLVAGWRVAVLGTLLQIGLSLAVTFALGQVFGWKLARIVLLGFVISLSSTSVVLKLLADLRETDSPVGQNALGILLVQDVAVIGMVIALDFLGGRAVSPHELTLQGVGALVLGGLLWWIWRVERVHIPFQRLVGDSKELQVFAALIVCFGLSLVTGLAGLSSALGAFFAGILIRAADETHWVHERLEPFRVVFVALFFVSVGSSVDVTLMVNRGLAIGSLVAAALVTNTVINAGILRFLGSSWRESFYGGAMLSQIGEFSFVLAAVGLNAEIIEKTTYDLTIAVIFLTLLVSPLWIMPFRRAFAPATAGAPDAQGSP